MDLRGIRGVLSGLLAATLALAAGGCGDLNDDFTGANIMQRTVLTAASETMVLTGGNTLHIPAGSFDESTVVIFANFFTGGDAVTANYPTPGRNNEDIIGAAVVNTPVDEVINQNLTLTFDVIRPDVPRVPSVMLPDAVYRVFRFDFETGIWQPWGGTTAQANAAGTQAVATLPTAGFLGFVGSLALFHEQLAGTVVPTVIRGTVRDQNGNGIATDVGLYMLVGGNPVPRPISNGRVPNLSDGGGVPFTVANTVDSNASGEFELQLPDNLVGQLVSLEFASEDPSRAVETRFDVLAPHPHPVSNVSSMSVQYGPNNVVSQPVR